MSAHAEWIDAMRVMPVASVAARLGFPIARSGAASKGSFPCPACGSERRHERRGDRRGACGLNPNGMGWRCFSCDASGDSISLVSYVVAGAGKLSSLDSSAKKLVREECERIAGVVPTAEVELERAAIVPVYPDIAEVKALWKASHKVSTIPSAVAWLGSRGISVEQVEQADIARVLPDFGSIPRWSTSWRAYGNRLLVKMVDADGVGRSIKARRMFTASEGAKSRAPFYPDAGYTVQGLVFASPVARTMLQGSQSASKVVLVEGEKKTLQQMRIASDAAVIGIASGSVSKQLLAKVPVSCEIHVRTDPDDAGAKYASEILAALPVARRAAVKLPRWLKVTDADTCKVAVWKE